VISSKATTSVTNASNCKSYTLRSVEALQYNTQSMKLMNDKINDRQQ